MKEQEYINCQELEKLKIIRSILEDVCVDNSDVIKKKELKIIYNIVNGWIDKLYNKIKIDRE
jgi:hypothetical protein